MNRFETKLNRFRIVERNLFSELVAHTLGPAFHPAFQRDDEEVARALDKSQFAMSNTISKTNVNAAQLNKLVAQLPKPVLNQLRYPDASVRAAANRLENANPFANSQIDAREVMELIRSTGDADNQAAGRELTGIQNFRNLHDGRLTEAAEQILDRYIGAAKGHRNQGRTGIPQNEWNNLMKEFGSIAAKEAPVNDATDLSVGRAIDQVLAQNPGKGDISATEAMGILRATRDRDGNAANGELKDIKGFIERFGDRLSEGAKKVLDQWVGFAEGFKAKGMKGIPSADNAKMMAQLEGLARHEDAKAAAAKPSAKPAESTEGSKAPEGTEGSKETGKTSGTESTKESSGVSKNMEGMSPMMQLALALMELAEKMQKEAADMAGSIKGEGDNVIDKKKLLQMQELVKNAEQIVNAATNMVKSDNKGRDSIIRAMG